MSARLVSTRPWVQPSGLGVGVGAGDRDRLRMSREIVSVDGEWARSTDCRLKTFGSMRLIPTGLNDPSLTEVRSRRGSADLENIISISQSGCPQLSDDSVPRWQYFVWPLGPT